MIDCQRHAFIYGNNQTHKRSYACICLDHDSFTRELEPYLDAYGIEYITQTNTSWNLSAMGKCEGEVWVTKRNGVGVVRIELLTDTITITDKEVYVVMWYRRFLPRFMTKARPYDVDYIMYNILEGRKKPRWEPLRLLSSFFLT